MSVRKFLLICADIVLAECAFNRGTLLRDHTGQIPETLGKLLILVEFGCHGSFELPVNTMALLRAIELAVLAGRTQKRANCVGRSR